MRVTAETKTATRRRLLEAAETLFVRDGWEATTTRGIAVEAGTATGTVFNYFPTKDAIAAALIRQALTRAAAGYSEKLRAAASLEEELFAWLWTGLRELSRLRNALGSAMVAVVSGADTDAEAIREEQVALLTTVAMRHGRALDALARQLFLSLYFGVLTQWTSDESRHSRSTMALLDHAVRLFVRSMGPPAGTNRHKRGGGR